MGICGYCQRKAGWFSDAHDACIQKANVGIRSIKDLVANAVIAGTPYSDVFAAVKQIKEEAAIPQGQVHTAIKEGWNVGAQERSKAQPISNQEANAILDFFKEAGLTDQEIVAKTQGSWAVSLSNKVWQVLHDQITPFEVPGEPPPGMRRNETIPGVIGTFGPSGFNLHPGEVAVWSLANVWLRQAVTTSSFVGGYGGPSIRVANGLWYRFGQVRGHREESTAVQDVDGGGLLITTRAVYFSGRAKGINLRLPYSQIIQFKSYADAVGICRNGAREQILVPQYMAWPDGIVTPRNAGWFLFNILQALAARDSAQRSFQNTRRPK